MEWRRLELIYGTTLVSVAFHVSSVRTKKAKKAKGGPWLQSTGTYSVIKHQLN